MSYQLIHGDCLEVMPTLADKSIDAIVCDLPYGTTNCSWDSVIPFEPLWAQYKRIIKPKGAIVLFGSQPFTSALVMSNIEWFKYCWVWKKDKATGHLNALVQPMADCEDIAVFGENGIRYYPQVEPKQKENIRPLSRRAPTDSYGKYNEQAERLIPLDMSFPKRVLNFPTTNHGERGYHPTQKPVSLLRYLLRTYTNEGETILDNTMGSGSTIVAAIQEGRNAIGIERDADYFAIAQRRCLEATYQPSLFTPQPQQWEPVAMFGDD